MNDRITPYVSIEEDEARSQIVRDAVAAYAIASAQRKAKPWLVTDEQVEKQLSKVSQRALKAMTLTADDAVKLNRAIREAMSNGDLLSHPDYLPEELEL